MKLRLIPTGLPNAALGWLIFPLIALSMGILMPTIARIRYHFKYKPINDAQHTFFNQAEEALKSHFAQHSNYPSDINVLSLNVPDVIEDANYVRFDYKPSQDGYSLRLECVSGEILESNTIEHRGAVDAAARPD